MALVNGTEYFYTAYFYDASGNYTRIDSSAVADISTPAPVVTSVIADDLQLTVTWNKVVGADEYIIYYGFAPDNYQLSKTIPVTAVGFDPENPSYTLVDTDDIVNNSTYWVVVSAVANGVESVKSAPALSATPTPVVTAAPQPLNVIGIAGNASFRVKWDYNAIVESWTIYYGEDIGILNHSVEVTPAAAGAPDVNGQVYFDVVDSIPTPAVNETTYFIKVKSHVGASISIFSEATSAIPSSTINPGEFPEGAVNYSISSKEAIMAVPLTDGRLTNISELTTFMQSPYAIYYDASFKTYIPGFTQDPAPAVEGATVYIIGASDRSGDDIVVRGDAWSNDNI